MKKDSRINSTLDISKNHYENFPVVSFLIPKKIRKDVAVIYWFARTADDLADEGNLSAEERLKKLKGFEDNLTDALEGVYKNALASDLSKTIKEQNLTLQYFYDLIKAFKQDVIKKSYTTFEEILDYCRYSANPVGRLMLELNNIRNSEAFNYSDKICTALQLTNFLQDLKIDYEKGRVYIPEDELAEFMVEKKMFELKENNLNLKKLLKFNIERIRKMFEEGRGLLKYLNGSVKYEIKWTIAGGEEVLNKIEKSGYNVLRFRPKLNKFDFLKLLLESFYD